MQYSDWTSKHVGAIGVGNFVIPVWYLSAIGLATIAYYAAFRRHDKLDYEGGIYRNTDSQIQGDENTVALASVQVFGEEDSDSVPAP